MSIESEKITINGLEVEVVRKAIKNLHLGVYPPEGRVRVAAPEAMSDDAIRMAVIMRISWIKKQKATFEGQNRETKREMVGGESHYFLGQRYRLNVVEHDGPSDVVIRNKSIMDLHVRQSFDVSERQKALNHWYRDQLKDIVPPLLEKWCASLEVQISDWGIKRMKTIWGSCNPEDRRIWINLELAKKPIRCIEYVILHELLHLKERHHGEKFVKLMNSMMPKWQAIRDELNQTTVECKNSTH